MLKEFENGLQVSDILIWMRGLHDYRYATFEVKVIMLLVGQGVGLLCMFLSERADKCYILLKTGKLLLSSHTKSMAKAKSFQHPYFSLVTRSKSFMHSKICCDIFIYAWFSV